MSTKIFAVCIQAFYVFSCWFMYTVSVTRGFSIWGSLLLAVFLVLVFWGVAFFLSGGLSSEVRLSQARTTREAQCALHDIRTSFFWIPMVGVIHVFVTPRRLREAEKTFTENIHKLLAHDFLNGFERENLEKLLGRLETIIKAEPVMVRANGDQISVIESLCVWHKDELTSFTDLIYRLVRAEERRVNKFMVVVGSVAKYQDGCQSFLDNVILSAYREILDGLGILAQNLCALEREMLRDAYSCLPELGFVVLMAYRKIPDYPEISPRSLVAFEAAQQAVQAEAEDQSV